MKINKWVNNKSINNKFYSTVHVFITNDDLWLFYAGRTLWTKIAFHYFLKEVEIEYRIHDMHFSEKEWLIHVDCSRKRHYDNIYLQTTSEDMADQFHSTMNNLHPKLKFEIEKPEITPNGHSLSLLDFKVTISKEGKSSFEFYKKTAKKPIFVHHQSAIPKKSKINFIRNEQKRIEDECTTKSKATKHQNSFDDVLRLNGYPESIIDQTKNSQNHQKDPRPLNTEWSYLKIPYISERLNHRIASIFRKEGIPVRVAHKSYTLRRAALRNKHNLVREIGQLALMHVCSLLLWERAVYQIMCNNCNQQYIGSTTRFIHDRVREHLNNGLAETNALFPWSPVLFCLNAPQKIEWFLITKPLTFLFLQLPSTDISSCLVPDLLGWVCSWKCTWSNCESYYILSWCVSRVY